MANTAEMKDDFFRIFVDFDVLHKGKFYILEVLYIFSCLYLQGRLYS